MKALIMSHQKDKKPAYDLIKQAIFQNMKSFTCWNIFAIMNKKDKNYDDAINCYLNAIKYDSENQNVLRELAMLQIQQRDYEGHANTRKLMLQQKPSLNNSWIAFAIANHLKKDYKMAKRIIDTFKKS